MRYRDNFFVALDDANNISLEATAAELTDLLQMPVLPVSVSSTVRCLELRLSFLPGRPVRSLLAFRTDPDRQGESGDVTSWPAREDPRTRMLLPGLLHGLAAKLRFYTVEGAEGFSATVRAMVSFLKARGYPADWWMRPFALSLLRVGVHPAVLPRGLRRALGRTMVSLNSAARELEK